MVRELTLRLPVPYVAGVVFVLSSLIEIGSWLLFLLINSWNIAVRGAVLTLSTILWSATITILIFSCCARPLGNPYMSWQEWEEHEATAAYIDSDEIDEIDDWE